MVPATHVSYMLFYQESNSTHLGYHIHRRIVLIRSTRRFVQQNQLITPRLGRHILLSLRRRTNHLIPQYLGHLRGPLTRPTRYSVYQTPLTGLNQIRMRRCRQIMRRHALHDTGRGHIQTNRFRDGQQFASRDCGILGVRSKDGIGDPVAHGHARDVVGDGRYHTGTFLAADKGEIAFVEAFAVVGVDKVDTGELVLDNDAAGGYGGSGKVGFDLQSIGVTDLTNDSGLRGE